MGFRIQAMSDTIIDREDRILVTGSAGFIGSRVVATLLASGYTNLRCFVRPGSNLARLHSVLAAFPAAHVEIVAGNLLSRADCAKAVTSAAVIYHLAAASDRTFAGSFMSCVITTRNLLDAVVQEGSLLRFVNISSFAVYTTAHLSRGGLLDESCSLDDRVLDRAEAYAYAKLKQEELVLDYARRHGVRYVMIRPGAVYGPGTRNLSGRVGVDTFGIFFHLGKSNQLPLTYVDNCAEAIVLAGLRAGVDGEVFNVVDDELPSSRKFLRLYKRHAKKFRSVPVPYWLFYAFSWGWERYSAWSKGQLPASFNRNRCATYWKGNRYTNQKLKDRLGWKPRIPFAEASMRYFDSVRKAG
jgi:nucleoside-diphosphate-sugar epimerase